MPHSFEIRGWTNGSMYARISEKQLFSKLMQEHSAFNQENQDPDWKNAVIVWNGNHAKGNENDIFYKVCSLV